MMLFKPILSSYRYVEKFAYSSRILVVSLLEIDTKQLKGFNKSLKFLNHKRIFLLQKPVIS